MSLLPVPYTDNWKDTFGAQAAPDDALSKMGAVTFNASQAPSPSNNEVSLSITGGLTEYYVIWADGFPPEPITVSAGVANHTYTRNGSYLIEVYDKDFPSNRARHRVRVTDIAQDTTGPGGVFLPNLIPPRIK